MNKTKVFLSRGAGLGFFVSAIIFVFTWNLWTLLFVPIGAGIGFLLSRFTVLNGRTMDHLSRSPAARAESRLVSLLASENLAVRFFSLWGAGIILFLIAWVIGYYLLPEGFFRSAAVSQLETRGMGGVAANVVDEWWRILRYNLLPFGLIILANLMIRIHGIGLGYIPPLYNLSLYGLFIGTNSFAIQYPTRLAPTIAILERAGPYEMTAFVLVAAATATWSFYEIQYLFRSNPQPVHGAPVWNWKQVVMIFVAMVILAGAAWVEASMIITGS